MQDNKKEPLSQHRGLFLLCGGRWFLAAKCFLQVALWGEVI